MDILLFNAFWMSWNATLAIVGVALSWLFVRAASRRTKLLIAPLWLAFVPNTIYIMTDIIHLWEQWQYVAGANRLILLAQYLVFIPIGCVSFYLSLRFFEQGIRPIYRRLSLSAILSIEAIIIVLNFLIALGVTMGRIQRTNSWEVLTNLEGVLHDMSRTFQSSHLLVYTMVSGVLFNMLYFSLRRILGARAE
jgi:uncharacterized membrane protein